MRVGSGTVALALVVGLSTVTLVFGTMHPQHQLTFVLILALVSAVLTAVRRQFR